MTWHTRNRQGDCTCGERGLTTNEARAMHVPLRRDNRMGLWCAAMHAGRFANTAVSGACHRCEWQGPWRLWGITASIDELFHRLRWIGFQVHWGPRTKDTP